MRLFLAVARTGSFLKAAEEVGLTQPTVSRRITELEERIGVALFTRHRHGSQLSPVGATVIPLAEAMERAAEDLNRHLVTLQELEYGTVTIAAGEGVVSFILPRYLRSLQEHCPDLSIRLISHRAADSEPRSEADMYVFPDVSADGAIALDPALRARRIGSMHFVPWVSEAYVDNHGTPANLDALPRHVLAHHTEYERISRLSGWTRLAQSRPSYRGTKRIEVDQTTALVKAIQSGAGIGLLPTYSDKIDPTLRRLSVGIEPMGVPLYLVANKDTLRNRLNRKVYDHLARSFAADRSWFGWFGAAA